MDLYIIKWHLNNSHGEIMHYGVYNSAFNSIEEAKSIKSRLMDNQEKNWSNHWGEKNVIRKDDLGCIGVYRKHEPYYLFLEIEKINTK